MSLILHFLFPHTQGDGHVHLEISPPWVDTANLNFPISYNNRFFLFYHKLINMWKEGEEIEEKARGEKVKNPSGNGDNQSH